jgi:hypothetical protein
LRKLWGDIKQIFRWTGVPVSVRLSTSLSIHCHALPFQLCLSALGSGGGDSETHCARRRLFQKREPMIMRLMLLDELDQEKKMFC